MTHIVIITDFIDLIEIDGVQHELDAYSEITGIDVQDLINSATDIITVSEGNNEPDMYHSPVLDTDWDAIADLYDWKEQSTSEDDWYETLQSLRNP